MGDRLGQTAERQINNVADLIAAIGVDVEVGNGYALPTAEQLAEITERIGELDADGRHELQGRLRVGVQWDTAVATAADGHCVTQWFGSALPVAYSMHDPAQWEPFARLVLEASYEATLLVGLMNAEATGNRRVNLTMLGGGAFGNAPAWIVDAIDRSLRIFDGADLDVVMVSHGSPNRFLRDLLR